METAALVGSIVSIIIGGFAIWLSVTFYRMANKISEDTKEAAKAISASVNRLESLFDSLYSDTFSMMKDTVSDMRKHIWPEKEQSSEALKQIEEKADAKIDELRKQIGSELSGMMARVGHTDSKIDDVRVRLSELVDRAIQQSRQVESEAQKEKSISEIMTVILEFLGHRTDLRVAHIINKFQRVYPPSKIMTALHQMIQDNLLLTDGDIKSLNTLVRINPL